MRGDAVICKAAQVALTVGSIVFGLYVATRLLGIDVGGGGGGGGGARRRGRKRGRSVRQSSVAWSQALPGVRGVRLWACVLRQG